MNELALVPVDEKTINDYLFSSSMSLSEAQKKLFLNIAVMNNLNPFNREIHPIMFNGTLKVVTGYEVYLKRAEKTKLLDGWGVEFESIKDDTKAILTIYRKDWTHPFTHEVLLSEYNTHQSVWKDKPKTMLRKVVIAQGFRLCFPEELGGMPYTSDEITEGTVTEIRTETKEKEIPLINENQRKMLHTIFGQCCPDEDAKLIVIKKYFNNKEHTTDVNIQELDAFIHGLEAIIGRSLEKGQPKISKSEFDTIAKFWFDTIIAPARKEV